MGRDHLVIDLSCRRTPDGGWTVCMNRWQTFTNLSLTPATLSRLAGSCAEFLVHAADVEGKCRGMDETLLPFLADHSPIPVTYAGGADVAQFTSTIDDDWGIEPWYGAAKLDGVKGYELLLLTSGGDGAMFRVLTWRKGALVAERAPKALMKGSYNWYLADLGFARFGYRFSTSLGHRYVRDFELYPSGKHWKGTVVKSVWKSGAWKKISSNRVTLTKKQAKAYNWLGGVKVIAKP